MVDLTSVTTFIETILKLPFFLFFKGIITILNVIPCHVYEVHGHGGYSEDNRPDLRSFHVQMKGRRRLNLGSAIIAYLNGKIFRADINTSGGRCWAVWDKDCVEIQRKWGL